MTGKFITPGKNPDYVKRMQELRRSNAAQPHRNKYRDMKRGMPGGVRPRFSEDS